MFDPEFFPTPASLACRLLSPYLHRLSHRSRDNGGSDPITCILEPSAGKGDILDWVRAPGALTGNYYGPKLLAIERNLELASVLQSKGYALVAHDFLTYRPDRRIDLILMNPPFSVGSRHLLHAWEILEAGDIACILNAETIRNPWTEERKLLALIIEDHGSVEFVGQAFACGAERSTDVEVAIVRLRKERSGRGDLDFEFAMPAGEDEAMPEDAIEQTGSVLMRPDQMGAMIRQYAMAKHAFVDYLRAREAMAFYCQGVVDPDKVFDLAQEACGGGRSTHRHKDAAFEIFKDSIRLKFWEHILQMVGMEKYLTSELRKKFSEFVEQQGAMALSKENIGQILSTIILNSGSIMQQAVVVVFDMFTAYHETNRVHVEGWKTNKAWKVNRKVILPNWVSRAYGWWAFNMYRRGEFGDIDKAMAYLAGVKLEDVIGVENALESEWKGADSGKCVSTFFEIRYFRKGTVHLTFRDEALWARFNIAACQGKGWLGHES